MPQRRQTANPATVIVLGEIRFRTQISSSGRMTRRTHHDLISDRKIIDSLESLAADSSIGWIWGNAMD
jgi:hypothetical protein